MDLNKPKGNSLLTDEQFAFQSIFEKVKPIGKGGMAEIFKAYQPSLGRYVVLKKLKAELESNPEVQERFRREAKTLSLILHQNIAHVFDLVETSVGSYILMEYMDGIDLSTVIQKVGAIPPREAASILLGVARGVAYIHTHELIHRDIKPSNIRLTSRGEVKLMDFGIAINFDNPALTQPGNVVGSPYYLSPEQVIGDNITQQTDIFLLGVTFYEMLTGVRPFLEEGNQTIFSRIRTASFLPPRKVNKSIPRSLELIIHQCLKKEPSRRYHSLQWLIHDLERFLGPQKELIENTILRFLDHEALLKISISNFESETTIRNRFSNWTHIISIGTLLVLSFFLGRSWPTILGLVKEFILNF